MQHNLGGDPDHYVVDFQFKDTEADGPSVRMVSHMSYGGGTFKLLPTEKTEYHGIGGNRDDKIVDMQFKDLSPSCVGVNQQEYGWNGYKTGDLISSWTGVAWSMWDGGSIKLARGPQDTGAEEMRIRIWENPAPDYDSKWVVFDKSLEKELIHNLEGNSDNYVLDLHFLDKRIHGVHQMYYGRNNSYFPDGTATSDGAFWFGLYAAKVQIHKEIDESSVDKIRIRMWVTGDIPSNYIYFPTTFH